MSENNILQIGARKAQTSMEFLILTAVLFLFFVSAFFIFASKIGDVANIRNEEFAEDIFDVINSEVTLAKQSLDGYSRIFKMPQNVNGLEYKVNIFTEVGSNNSEILVRVEKYEEYFELSDYLQGQIGIGNNTVSKINGRISIVPDTPFEDIIGTIDIN